MKKLKRRLRMTAMTLLLSMLLTACGGGTAEAKLFSVSASKETPAPGEEYKIPAFLDSMFHEDKAEDYGVVRVDASALEDGYLALQASSAQKLKFQVQCGEQTYTYSLANDGTTEIIPLNMGDGSYSFFLMENIVDNKYACAWSGTKDVKMKDEFQCYLRPSQMSKYDEGSECVKKAKELAASCRTDVEIVAEIYSFLVKNISYDTKKAKTVSAGYLPLPDETLATKKGICFDYASLACAMMRSLGIPCKLIMGYVDGELYHAWNSFYLENTGWVTVGIEAPSRQWQRVDITLAASGTSVKDLTDDGKYTTRYEY